MTRLWKQFQCWMWPGSRKVHPPTTCSRGPAVQDHPFEDAERLRAAGLARITVPNFFCAAFERPDLRFEPSGWGLGC